VEALTFWKYAIFVLGGIIANVILAYLSCLAIALLLGGGWQSFRAAAELCTGLAQINIKALSTLLTHPISFFGSISSPIGIASEGAGMVSSTPVKVNGVEIHGFLRSAIAALYFSAILNLGLAVFNLLPIPLLDGGRLAMRTIGLFVRIPGYVERRAVLFSGLVLLGMMVFAVVRDVAALVVR
jgi:membrane-associated protease RseP (regulator of RpoE activity)